MSAETKVNIFPSQCYSNIHCIRRGLQLQELIPFLQYLAQLCGILVQGLAAPELRCTNLDVVPLADCVDLLTERFDTLLLFGSIQVLYLLLVQLLDSRDFTDLPLPPMDE